MKCGGFVQRGLNLTINHVLCSLICYSNSDNSGGSRGHLEFARFPEFLTFFT